MAAEENSVEGFAALGRILIIQRDMSRAMKDYLMKSSNRFMTSQDVLRFYCFQDLVGTLIYCKQEYKQGEELEVLSYGMTGLILFRLIFLNDSKSSKILLNELLLFPKIAGVYFFFEINILF